MDKQEKNHNLISRTISIKSGKIPEKKEFDAAQIQI